MDDREYSKWLNTKVEDPFYGEVTNAESVLMGREAWNLVAVLKRLKVENTLREIREKGGHV